MQEWASIIFDIPGIIFTAIWIMLPAYLPNSAAAVFGGGLPVDLGRSWGDGRRILGDGKTWRGFAGGVISGIVIGLAQVGVQEAGYFPDLPVHTLSSILLLSTGALLGDMVKSFFKRRRGLVRGGKWPLIDQYDFLAGALLLLIIGDPGFFFEYLTLPVLVVILILTPLLHRIVNIIGYYIGVKEVPW